MTEKLREKIENPIVFKYITIGSEVGEGQTVHGYETGVFVEILKLLLEARDELTKTQMFLAKRFFSIHHHLSKPASRGLYHAHF